MGDGSLAPTKKRAITARKINNFRRRDTEQWKNMASHCSSSFLQRRPLPETLGGNEKPDFLRKTTTAKDWKRSVKINKKKNISDAKQSSTSVSNSEVINFGKPLGPNPFPKRYVGSNISIKLRLLMLPHSQHAPTWTFVGVLGGKSCGRYNPGIVVFF